MVANGIFSKLSLRARKRIYDFQNHILVQERSFRPQWPQANTTIKEIAQEIVRSLTDDSLPIKFGDIIRDLNITLKNLPASASKTSGKLYPVNNGFELIIFGQTEEASYESNNNSFVRGLVPEKENEVFSFLSPRGRFTFAHELGHVFFYTSDTLTSKPRPLLSTISNRDGNAWRIEGLCNDFAGALLIPDKYRDYIEKSPTLPEIVKIIRTFNVSAEPAVRRILYDWGEWPYSLLVRIELQKNDLKIKCFRGTYRKKETSDSPTSSGLSRLIGKMKSIVEIENKLTAIFKLEKNMIRSNKSVIWAIL